MLRLKNLKLHNFRCFENCEITFQHDLTVLVARNGQGKTAVLDAIALALGLFVDTVSGSSQWSGFSKRDVRRVRDGQQTLGPPGYVEFQAQAEIDSHQISWRRWMRSDAHRSITSKRGASELADVGSHVRAKLQGNAADAPASVELPFVGYYGTGRRWNDRDTKRRRGVVKLAHDRCVGYIDCLYSSANYRLFSNWYERTFLGLGAPLPVTGTYKADRGELLLAAVNRAVDSVLDVETGWHSLIWDLPAAAITLTHAVHGQLPVDFLSDGVRNTVALVADVAHRCARLNPHLGEDAAKETPGLLLIDEVDLHLHPEWQQSIIRMLRTAFPKLQLILSTHSPQVLSTVDVSAIRALRLVDGSVCAIMPQFQTKGTESADVLAAIMGVDPVPTVSEAKWLSDYRALIEQGQWDSPGALGLREQLFAHFGPYHPVMLECDRLVRFSQFKKRLAMEAGNDAPS